MPTDEERREVARMLRSLEVPARVKRKEHTEKTAMWYELICGSVGGKKDPWFGVKALADRLADLIDPTDETCEAELIYAERGRGTIKVFECSKCGKSWEQVFADDFTFCPYCGKRVSYADE